MVRRPGLMVVSVLVALVVGGCDGGDPEPEFSDEVSLSPSASASAGEASPSESFDPTEESAREFIRRWVEVSNTVQKTGKVKPYRQMVASDCRPCDEFADRVRDIYRNGGYIKTDGLTAEEIVHDGANQWTVSYRSAPTEYRESTGGDVQKLDGGRYDNRVFLRETQRGWQVEHIDQVSQ